MRTTLILNDELVQAAKIKAAKTKTNLSALVNEALRASLNEKASLPPPTPFKMQTYSPPSAKPVHTTPEEFYELLVAEEMEPYQT
jgi:hypothetical protein